VRVMLLRKDQHSLSYMNKTKNYNQEKQYINAIKPKGISMKTLILLSILSVITFISPYSFAADSVSSGVGKDHKDVKVLLDFEESDFVHEKNRHYLSEYDNKAVSGKRSAIVRFAKYNNLRITDSIMKDWSGYDYLALEIFNPLDIGVPFSLVINDQSGGGYWNQLNHNTMISPGWNTLKFHVNRYVGERGAIRHYRYLDLKHIQKVWFAVACEDKRKNQFKDAKFLVDNIRLLKAPKPPKPFDGLRVFDFVKDKFRTQRGFETITKDSLYSNKKGFGFVDTIVHGPHDSEHASTLNRDGIWVNKGSFRVDLPNGKYFVYINVNHLGLWYEQYWKKRTLRIQGETVLDQTCISIKDHLNRFLRFVDIEPEPEDNPYDLYIKDVFKPIVKEVEVKNAYLNIEFEGSVTGICMNWLALYPSKREKQGREFMKNLTPVLRDEYDQLMKYVPKKAVVEEGAITSKHKKEGIYTALIGSDQFVRYGDIIKSVRETIDLSGGYGERPMQAFMVRNLDSKSKNLEVTCSTLVSTDGKRIKPQVDWIRYGVNQYQSWKFKHESYHLTPRFLRQLPQKGLVLKKNLSRLLWLQIPLLDKSVKAGTYKGALSIKVANKTINYPITLTLHPYELPQMDIAAGWFGLDPMPWGWYRPAGQVEWDRNTRTKILDILSTHGFTTWSSLPEIRWGKNKAGKYVPKVEDVDHLMKEARKKGFRHKVFTYLGIPFNIIHNDGKSGLKGMDKDTYFKYASKAWNKAVKKGNWLPIVYDYSDEASGYSQRVAPDLKSSKILKKYYPSLLRGGFSHAIKKGEYGYDLNLTFTDISVSSMTKTFSDTLKKKGKRWGFYNPCLVLTQNNRQAYGEALFASKKDGCDHLLGWCLAVNQNYPYYDLDGRENDAIMLFLRKDGGFDKALKFEWASLGTEDYRLLMLLESLVKKSGSKGKVAQKWLKENYYDIDIFKHKNYLTYRISQHSYKKSQAFRKEVKSFILELL